MRKQTAASRSCIRPVLAAPVSSSARAARPPPPPPPLGLDPCLKEKSPTRGGLTPTASPRRRGWVVATAPGATTLGGSCACHYTQARWHPPSIPARSRRPQSRQVVSSLLNLSNPAAALLPDLSNLVSILQVASMFDVCVCFLICRLSSCEFIPFDDV